MVEENRYDVVIVGAGPAGLFAAYELIKSDKNLKIALIDMGKRIENRLRCEVMSGFGGAGTFSDGKLGLTANLSHEKMFPVVGAEKYQKALDYIDNIFTSFGVDSEYYPKNQKEVNLLEEEAQKNDIQLVIKKERHVGTDKLVKVMKTFQDYLENKGVTLIDSVNISDLIIENNTCKGVVSETKSRFFSNKILLAPGRVNARWLQEMASKYGVKYMPDMVEIGVRVEFPSFVMRRHAETLYEVVFKVRTPTFDDVVRTFCSCPHGYVATEKYDGYVCVNGHSNSDHSSSNSNFALLSEIRLTEPVENTLAYAKSIAEVASTIGGGKPIIQRLVDLRSGRRSTPQRIDKSFIKPSLADVTPGDISMAFPYRIVKNLLEALEKLDSVMPGINAGSTLLYAPEVKFRSSKMNVGPDMQTSLKGVYVAGDASGLSGQITGAAVTGVFAARGMLQDLPGSQKHSVNKPDSLPVL